jgi:Ca2+-dependent lipid-binding protein
MTPQASSLTFVHACYLRSYVKITLGGCVRKTRPIYRNTHPMWEQSMALPLNGIPDAQPLVVELYDKDFRGKEFLGQVLMTLGKARNIAQQAALGESYWCVIVSRAASAVYC